MAEDKLELARGHLTKAAGKKRDHPAVADLQGRLQKRQNEILAQQQQDRIRTEVDGLIAQGLKASQEKQWALATNKFGEAVRQASGSRDPKLLETARTRFDYAQSMDAAERFLTANKPDDALQELDKVLKETAADPAANDLKKRAESRKAELKAQQEFARRRGDVDGLLADANRHAAETIGPKLQEYMYQAAQQADELKDQPRSQRAKADLDFAQSMESGEKFYSENHADEALIAQPKP